MPASHSFPGPQLSEVAAGRFPSKLKTLILGSHGVLACSIPLFLLGKVDEAHVPKAFPSES